MEGLSWYFSGKDAAPQCRRPELDPWPGTRPHMLQLEFTAATKIKEPMYCKIKKNFFLSPWNYPTPIIYTHFAHILFLPNLSRKQGFKVKDVS